MRRLITLSLTMTAMLTTSCRSESFFKREVHSLEGASEARLTRQFGHPDRVFTNTVGELACSPEPWRTPIPQVLLMFPTNAPANLPVQIKSLSWPPRGKIVLTVWLRQESGQWVSFYAEEWNMDVIE